ncbi:MAG: hypothetical protein WCI77_08580 [Candidatus Omnitrophota bacterium]
MFGFKKHWICKIAGHSFKKVKDLRMVKLHRERVVYRCERCGQPLVIREKERRQMERRQNTCLDHRFDLKYTT